MKEQSSIPLVKLVLTSGFLGPVIANSSDEHHNELLQKAGCTHVQSNDYKTAIVPYVLELSKK